MARLSGNLRMVNSVMTMEIVSGIYLRRAVCEPNLCLRFDSGKSSFSKKEFLLAEILGRRQDTDMDPSIEVPYQETLNTPAARLLYRVMTGISEDCWCAGWLVDCEYALWANLTGKDVAGVKAWRISEHEVEELRLAHKIADGWIVSSDERRGLIFLTTEEWLEHLAALSKPSK